MIRHVSVIGCVLAFAWLVTRGGSTRAEERQDERLYVPAGWFTMGSSPEQLAYARRLCVTERLPLGLGVRGCADDALFAREIPARRVYVSAFFIDRFELSQAHWALCLARGDCAPPAREVTHPSLQGPALPVVGISHHGGCGTARAHRGD